MKALDHINDLTPDPRNARKHNPRNIGMVEESLQEVGAARSIVIDENNVVLAGNGVIEAAGNAGITKLKVVDADGSTIIAVRRIGLTAKQKTRLALFDNRAAELAEWDTEELARLIKDDSDILKGQFSDEEITDLLDVPPASDEEKRKLDVVSLPFGLHYSPTIVRRKGVGLVACSVYGAEQEVIDDIKEWKNSGNNEDQNIQIIANVIAKTIKEIGLGCECVTTPQRHHEGFHAGTAIAVKVAKNTGVPFVDLFGFKKEGTGHHPIKNASRKKPSPAKNIHGPVVIVDDVATSGETMRSAIQSIRDIKHQAAGIVLVHYWNEHE